MSSTGKNPRCRRTGGCCKGLVVSNALQDVEAMRRLTRYRRRKSNYSAKFLKGWEKAARMAEEAGRSTFTCPFLQEGHICGLQDRKPGICSSSLSKESLEQKDFLAENTFFHAKCGWLEGAPPLLVKIIEVRDKMFSLTEDDPERDLLQEEYDSLREEYDANPKDVRLVDGLWAEVEREVYAIKKE